MWTSASRKLLAFVAGLSLMEGVWAVPIEPRENQKKCRKTTVVVLGGGMAGITAAQALANQSITDFLIVEYNGEIGGRMKHTNFGKKKDGSPFVVELGANWVQGLGTKGGPENPIWTMAKKYKVANEYSNYSSILTLIDDYETAYAEVEQYAGVILKENLQDTSMRAGLALKDFKPQKNMAAQARGFNALAKGMASTFLKPNDSRLLLNSIVTDIAYDKDSVTISLNDGSCISAAYAICTFSLGVLQNDEVSFTPKLPDWKQTAIAEFQMGTYTKVFLQFNETFWDLDTQFFLYASPTTRGYYPVWQSLSTAGFLPGSNIIFATVVERESYRIEAQDDEVTKAEALAVLREMFPDKHIPEPIDFFYPRWTKVPWAHGSYSNWPVGTTLEGHQNLRSNVGRLYFAGEHCSAEYFGFLQGAYFEGQEAGMRIAGMLGKKCKNMEGGCGEYKRYEALHGTTRFAEFSPLNGWDVSSFYVAGK
ncbi:putative flavin-containing polyamine oxidase [Lophium mytilinum]|uniref:Putative flavin-containing polyamine oxidase n=1 Tax=Lophium mytilinum TaxID=390894 RepID=A0A6A6QWT5_9PEZI|nr:putative flavin-containing polyamine oxidase [Lophium mytilinum]